jgi:hypothetical protein
MWFWSRRVDIVLFCRGESHLEALRRISVAGGSEWSHVYCAPLNVTKHYYVLVVLYRAVRYCSSICALRCEFYVSTESTWVMKRWPECYTPSGAGKTHNAALASISEVDLSVSLVFYNNADGTSRFDR